jgi:hypothetical protein
VNGAARLDCIPTRRVGTSENDINKKRALRLFFVAELKDDFNLLFQLL